MPSVRDCGELTLNAWIADTACTPISNDKRSAYGYGIDFELRDMRLVIPLRCRVSVRADAHNDAIAARRFVAEDFPRGFV